MEVETADRLIGQLGAPHANFGESVVIYGTDSPKFCGRAVRSYSDTGGAQNTAEDPFASVAGGCGNLILASATIVPKVDLEVRSQVLLPSGPWRDVGWLHGIAYAPPAPPQP